jgi:hypothetical protein
MIKTIELIVAIFLMIFCFFAGVKYSDGVKSHASWLFESKEDDVELPDLSSESEVEITVPGEGAAVDQSAPQQPAANAPADYVDEGDSGHVHQ